MNEQTKQWVKELAQTERKWDATRIAAWVQRGWSFLGTKREDYEREKAEIIAYVQEVRRG